MNQTLARTGAVLVALLMVASVMTGGVTADYGSAPAIDTDGTDDTASVSELQPGDTLGDNYTFAANSSENTTTQWISDSNSTAMEIQRNGSDHVAYRNDSAAVINWNSTDSDGHYNATFSHDQLADIEHGIAENVTMNLTTIDNATLDAENQTTTTDTFYIEFDNSSTTAVVDDGDVSSSSIVEVADENATTVAGLEVPMTGDDQSTIETNDREVNGSATDVVIVMSNATVAEDFDTPIEGASAGDKLSSFGLTRTVALVHADDSTDPVPVFYSEAPDSVSESDTYAVYQTVGGEDALVVNLGDDYSDASTVSVEAVGNAGLLTFASEYAMAAFSMQMSGGATLGFGVLFVGVGRRGRIVVDEDEQDEEA